jgi:hypothetical protein
MEPSLLDRFGAQAERLKTWRMWDIPHLAYGYLVGVPRDG